MVSKETDLLRVCDSPNTSNFSIRNYVFASRNKGIGIETQNWPFSREYLQFCIKSGFKNLLPPFEPPDLIRTQFHLKVKKSTANHRVPRVTSEIKSKLLLKPSFPDPISNTSIPEQMNLKTCPVCKIFKSGSNTTLNAHMDQCLFTMESKDNKSTEKLEGNFVKSKVKLKKKRSMVEIYAVAPHGTILDLDKRNGTNWAAELAALVPSRPREEICKGAQETKIFTNRFSGGEGEVYVDSNGIKVRILSEFDNQMCEKVKEREKKKTIGPKSSNLKKEKLKLQKIRESQIEVSKSGGSNLQNIESTSDFSKVTEMPTMLAQWARSKRSNIYKNTPRRLKKLQVSPPEKFAKFTHKPEDLTVSRRFRKQRTGKRISTGNFGLENLNIDHEMDTQEEQLRAREGREANDGLITAMPLGKNDESTLSCSKFQLELKETNFVRNEENNENALSYNSSVTSANGYARSADRCATSANSSASDGDSEVQKQTQKGEEKANRDSTDFDASFCCSCRNLIVNSKEIGVSKLQIGPRPESSFTSYQNVSKPNLGQNQNLGQIGGNLNLDSTAFPPSPNPVLRLMGKDVMVNCINNDSNVPIKTAPNPGFMLNQQVNYPSYMMNESIYVNFSNGPNIGLVGPVSCYPAQDGSGRSEQLIANPCPNQVDYPGSNGSVGFGSGPVFFGFGPAVYYPQATLRDKGCFSNYEL